MADSKADKSDRTDLEKQNAAELLSAQKDKAVAEAELARAEARKVDVEASHLMHDEQFHVLAKEKLVHERSKELAADAYHQRYRFTGQVDAASVKVAMNTLTAWSRMNPGSPIEIIFSSPGGSVIEGFVLFDFIRELSEDGHEVTTGMLGMAASMGGVLMQAGDKRWAGKESWYMIHRAAFGASGKTFDIEDEVEWVKRVEKRIIDIFVRRSSLTATKIRRNWDRKDWWIDADQALEFGLIDNIRGSQPEA